MAKFKKDPELSEEEKKEIEQERKSDNQTLLVCGIFVLLFFLSRC